jgi:hypothetical protein
MSARVTLERLDGTYAVSRLAPADPIPDWADGTGFVSISRSTQELSVVCRADRVPPAIRQDGDWSCYRFVGPFAFDETGIVSAVIGPLSDAGIGIFVVSTFDGDHLLLKQADLSKAEPLLAAAGHRVIPLQ